MVDQTTLNDIDSESQPKSQHSYVSYKISHTERHVDVLQEVVMRCARAMHHIGVQEYDAVAIIGFNSPEWFVADLAAIACGAVATGELVTIKKTQMRCIHNL